MGAARLWGSAELLVRRLLSVRSAGAARYTPDGCIVYLSDVTGFMVPWRYCPGRGHDILLPWERRVGALEVSREGAVAFSSDFDGDERWAIYVYDGGSLVRVAGEDGSMNLLGPWSESGRFLAYASNARNGVDFDLYVYDSVRGESRLVAVMEGINTPAAWVGDKTVVVVKRNTNLDSDLVLVDVESGSKRLLTPHEGEAEASSPAVAEDGLILYATNEGREFKALAAIDPATGSSSILLEPPGDVEHVEYSDGVVYVSVNVRGSSRLEAYRLLPGGRLQPLWRLERKWVVTSLDPGRAGLLASATTPSMGAEVFLVEPRAGGGAALVERVTRSPKLGLEGGLVDPEDFEYESFDGLRIHGLYYRPPRPAGDPPPGVVWLHGGPESQARPQFNPLIQALALSGAAVAAPNFRGSTGYGKTFTHLDDVEKRLDAVKDVYYAVEYLASRGMVDPSRLCVMGGSYGGYLTLMSMALYPDLWRCGVEIVGIVNLVTFIRNTSPYRRRYRIPEYGDPDRHGDVMLRLSPITHADKIKAPLMVVHGARDPRVPVGEAEQIVEALRRRGVEVVYIRLEDEGHGIAKIPNRVRVYTEAVKFIARHLGLQVG